MNQQPALALTDTDWDVAVVGAGPAGSVAAMLLARRGHRVALLDRHQFPREKVCGDGLTEASIAILERLGVAHPVVAAAHEVRELRGFSPSQQEAAIPGRFVTLRRATFDALLAQQAVTAGATFCRGEVTGLEPGPSAVAIRVAGRAEPFSARFAVLATGANVRLARRLGLVERIAPTAACGRCYVRSSFPLDAMVVSFHPALVPGYMWIFPMSGGEYNVGCCVLHRAGSGWRANLRKAFDAAVADLPVARDLFGSADRVSPLRGAMLRCGFDATRRAAAGPVVAVGETIGSTLHFSGEGISQAMRTAEFAAASLHEALATGRREALSGLSRQIEAALRPRHLVYALAEKAAARPWLNDFLARHSGPGTLLRRMAHAALSPSQASLPARFLRGVVRAAARLRRRKLRG